MVAVRNNKKPTGHPAAADEAPPGRARDWAAPGASERAGFTLIELLVVVTILALLISILMPSLKKARDQTKRTVCASNLRQIGIGLHGYMADSNDRLPHGSNLPSKQPFPVDLPESIFVADVLAPYLGEQREVFHCPNDLPDDRRPAPNSGLSYFESERSSYEYRYSPFFPPLVGYPGGKTITEFASGLSERFGSTVAPASIWLLRDYRNFHAPKGQPGTRRYLYYDGHVADYEN